MTEVLILMSLSMYRALFALEGFLVFRSLRSIMIGSLESLELGVRKERSLQDFGYAFCYAVPLQQAQTYDIMLIEC